MSMTKFTTLHSRALLLSTIIGSAGLAGTHAIAAEGAKSFSLEEIVVTARKFEEGLQDSPISISAYTSQAIEKLGVTNIQQVAEYAPNVVFDFTAPVSGASSAAAVFIRGIGQNDFALTTEAGVGTYVDGVYMSRSIGGVLDVLDVERIEILRGPQGTLFGRNTIGGAISITSQKPSDEFGGSFEMSAGQRGRVHVRGVVDVPLDDTLSVRLAASSKDRDGYVQTVNPGDPSAKGIDLGNENRQAFRALATWQASENLTASLTADYSRIRENNAASILRGVTGDDGNPLEGPIVFIYNTFGAPGLNYPGFPNAEYTDANFVTGDLKTSYATGPNGTSIDAWGLGLTLDWDVSQNLTFKSISAYRATDGFFNRDADGSPTDVTHTSNSDYEHKQFSQEFQAIGSFGEGRLRYVAGLYFFAEEGSDPTTVPLSEAFGTVVISDADIDNKSYAAYLQATYDLTDALAVTAGIRYTKDKKDFFTNQYIEVGSAGPNNPFLMFAPAGLQIPLVPPNSSVEADFTDVSPRVSVDYRVTEDLMLYASYSQGFKSGGFNLRYVAPRNGVLPFDPEQVDSFEAGFKFEGLDRRLRLNGAAFYTDYTDIQVTVFEGLGAPVTLNSGDAEIWGGELELTALLTPDLQITGAVGYTHAEYTELRVNPANILTPFSAITLDNKLPNVPKWQTSLAVDYTVPMDNGAAIDLHFDWKFTSKHANDAQNSPFLNQDSYNVLNAGVTYQAASGNWSLRFFVDNITDERYIVSGDSNFGIGFHEANYNRPREWFVTFKANY